jgi:lipopolysaccharide/colanic/teichoic acid biosynthesis glycosyltransferase
MGVDTWTYRSFTTMLPVPKEHHVSELASDSCANPARHSLLKTAIDVVLSIALLVCLTPLFVVLALLIKVQDGGPVFYRRRVVGNQVEFDAFKFRTMRPDADSWLASEFQLKEQFERNFKLVNDPRVTPFGAFLRKFSLDELPQLFNVLRGEMSLVGPRMITATELEKYGADRDLLRTVKPGLTGYWQVNGRQSVSYDERVQMDLFYIRNWTICMDLKIILTTPMKILRREGAW